MAWLIVASVRSPPGGSGQDFCASGGTDGSASLEETGRLTGIPTIASITPDVGATGSLVTVSGANLSPSSQLVFDATAASTTVVSSTELQAVVPSAIPCGTSVTVSSGGPLPRRGSPPLRPGRLQLTRTTVEGEGRAGPRPGHRVVTDACRPPAARHRGPTRWSPTDLTSSGRGGQRVEGTASPIAVTGLMPGDVYSFAVSAANSVGSGPVSQPSNPVELAIAPAYRRAEVAGAGQDRSELPRTAQGHRRVRVAHVGHHRRGPAAVASS